jgi:hypothetical protein
MMRFFFALLLLLSAGPSGTAQTFFSNKEWGVSGVATQYFGDLNDHYGFKDIRPGFGGFFRLHLTPYIAMRSSVLFTQVGYADRYNSNAYQQQRNLSFSSNIIEASVQAEFNFFRYVTGEDNSRFTPYLTGGIGAFYYKPTTQFAGETYDLRALGTEGQNAGYTDRSYGRFNVCFPVGIGIKYWLRPGFNLGIEIADRLTLTDYLDDVSTTYVGADQFPTDPIRPNPAAQLQDRSLEVGTTALGRAGKQRGNNQTYDQYLMVGLHLSIQLKTYRCPKYLKEGYYMY